MSINITRRSFVRKSSYSAAAVTILGTGIGLAVDPSSVQNTQTRPTKIRVFYTYTTSEPSEAAVEADYPEPELNQYGNGLADGQFGEVVTTGTFQTSQDKMKVTNVDVGVVEKVSEPPEEEIYWQAEVVYHITWE